MPLYLKNQLVWAKVKGYPWWPAIVAKSNQAKNGSIEDQVLVNFIGENSHATLSMDKIVGFEDEFEQHSVTKNKKLTESIKVAQRIAEKETTYEEEKSKMLRRLLREDSEDSKPEKETKRTRAEPNKSPAKSPNKRISRKGQKLKNKESKVLDENKNLEGWESHRFTRSRSRQENVEMLTEPLIYPSRRSQQSPGKDRRRGLSKGYIKRTNSKAGLNKTRTRSETQKATKAEQKTMVTRKRATGKEPENSPGNGRRKSLRSRGKMEEEEEDNNEEEDDNEDEKEEVKEEKKVEKKPTPKSKRGQHLRKDARTKNKDIIEKPKDVERDMELEELLQDVDEDEYDGSFDVMEGGGNEANNVGRTRNNKAKNLKRLTSRESDLPSPKYLSQMLSSREPKSILSENEYIVKKLKPTTNNNSLEEGFANSSARTVMPYNSLKIKKMAGELEQNMYKLSAKFQRKDQLREEDEESIQLSSITRELDNNEFSGAEYMHSEVGKILKTTHYLLTKNTDLLHKMIDETLVGTVGRILKKIETKIIQYCLDNTDYMHSLNLLEDNRDTLPEENAPMSNQETEGNNRMKIDDQNSESDQNLPVLNLDNNLMSSKIMEEDEQSRLQGTPIKGFNPHLIKEDSMTISSVFEKNDDKISQSQSKNDYSQKPKTDHFETRKTICKKFAALLQRVYAMEKDKAQDIARATENKINNFHINTPNDYKTAIKGLLKIIKNNKFAVEELNQIQNMGINDFAAIMKQKLESIPNIAESPENSVSEKISSIPSNSQNVSTAQKKEKNGDNNNATPRKSSRISKKGGPGPGLDNLDNGLFSASIKGEAH